MDKPHHEQIVKKTLIIIRSLAIPHRGQNMGKGFSSRTDHEEESLLELFMTSRFVHGLIMVRIHYHDMHMVGICSRIASDKYSVHECA